MSEHWPCTGPESDINNISSSRRSTIEYVESRNRQTVQKLLTSDQKRYAFEDLQAEMFKREEQNQRLQPVSVTFRITFVQLLNKADFF